jgi:hypothetical protein
MGILISTVLKKTLSWPAEPKPDLLALTNTTMFRRPVSTIHDEHEDGALLLQVIPTMNIILHYIGYLALASDGVVVVRHRFW